MQIASDKKAFILDLIKLFADCPKVLDNCLTRILQSPILKLGIRYLTVLIPSLSFELVKTVIVYCPIVNLK